MKPSVEVCCRRRWVPTPVWVSPGDRLDLKASGVWVDAVIPCSPDGYDGTIFYTMGRPPRVPDGQRYFRLMGRIVEDGVEPTEDDPALTFVVGARTTIPVTHAGQLMVFCNDRAGFYWNNWGSVRLSVERIAAS